MLRENPPLLEAVGLRRAAANGRVLLDDVSLQLNAGEILALRGPSGSGKTVLLRALTLLDPLDAGVVKLEGAEPSHHEIPAFRRRVLYVHQQPVLVPGSVADNLRLPFELGGHGEARFSRDQAVGLLERMGRAKAFLAAGADDLSGGERQIVALIRALVLQPSVLLLDEPSAALDPEAVERLEGLVVEWVRGSESRRAVLWITHAGEQAERISDRRLRMTAASLRDEEGT